MFRIFPLVAAVAVPALYAGQPLLAGGASAIAVAARPAAEPRPAAPEGLRAAPDEDGLFRLACRRAGQSVAMVVDTGATMTVLTAADARALDIPVDQGLEGRLHTANGVAAIRYVHVDGLVIGGRRIGPADVAVAGQGLPHSLLGIDVIGKLGRLTIEDGQLEISA